MAELDGLAERAWEIADKSGFHEARSNMTATQRTAWLELLFETQHLAEKAEMLRDEPIQEDDPIIGPIPRWKGDLACALVLMVTEIAEAAEVLIAARTIQDIVRVGHNEDKNNKPEGFSVELADCIIRILDTMRNLNLPVSKIVEEKIEYNATRPFMHGRGA